MKMVTLMLGGLFSVAAFSYLIVIAIDAYAESGAVTQISGANGGTELNNTMPVLMLVLGLFILFGIAVAAVRFFMSKF